MRESLNSSNFLTSLPFIEITKIITTLPVESAILEQLQISSVPTTVLVLCLYGFAQKYHTLL